MNFQEKLAEYVLENRTTSQHPDIALTGLAEGLDSDSLIILAGMDERDNTFELQQYFEQMLSELKLKLPNKFCAANVLITYHLERMINDPKQSFEIMTTIKNEIDDAFDWPMDNTTKYLGEELDLHHLYTWYRELQDLEDGSLILYYTDLPKVEQKRKFEEHLIEEAKNWLNRNKNTL
ncbi:hypothetical protein [Reichenbachiella versicolor]|uniref:hypothetical protein n=1 Tax=Reichenbachiella versicolor TaxID=1821036 RepID=UPI000D6E75E2|nr:hypothetical protein [Reichenbachiella versicolor]